jgi:pyruvate/2-oxoacid:ferredoxin oxidoreductase alpha subunit
MSFDIAKADAVVFKPVENISVLEGLGWAGMNEVPVVISLYQRAGPATGLPTRREQGDLIFAIRAGHGEFPRVVFASGDIDFETRTIRYFLHLCPAAP